MEKTYVQKREEIINVLIVNAKEVYTDVQLVDNIIAMSAKFECSGIDKITEEVIDDMYGFILWADMTRNNLKRMHVVSTLIHDLSEYLRNKNEAWFCPRTHGYKKFIPVFNG